MMDLDVPQIPLHPAVALALGGFLAVVIGEIYKRWGETLSNREEFSKIFPLLTLATIVVVTIARESIALSLGLIGAVSIVRYRAAIKSPEELVYVLCCVSVGLALGANQPLLAATLVPVVGLFIAVRHITTTDPQSSSVVPDLDEAAAETAVPGRPANLTLVSTPLAHGAFDLTRRELKFALPHADSDKVRSVLKVNCQRISHRGPSTLVSTIYFDDCFLNACREHIDGAARRAKVRLRWYDDDLENIFFEIKRREYSMVHKERLQVQSRVPITALTYEEILEDLYALLPQPASELLRSRAEPTLITQYRREYFRSRGSPARLTLDEQIVCYSQLGVRQPTKRFGIKDTGFVILEAKVSQNSGDELREVLHPLAPCLTKSSKYVRGCLQLALLDETEMR